MDILKAFFLVSFLGVALLLSGCDSIAGKKVELTTEYQAVFLDNGQVFFGRLEKAGTKYPVLRDVFYIHRVVEKDSDQKDEVRSMLIKRGNELHGPDRMHINSAHIVLIEPVSLSSKVAQLIKEAMQGQGPSND